MDKKFEIKVDDNIKPLDVNKRKPFDFIIDDKYYVSFSMNVSEPCRLLKCSDEIEDGFPVRITIELRDSATRVLYGFEIGRTPEEAVLNQAM